MDAKKHSLEFFYDISCPFAYIASTRVEALTARVNANLIWTPVLLGAIYRLTSAPQGAAGSASDVFNSAKRAISSASFARTLKRYQIPYNPSSTHLRKTTAALRLIHHVQNAERALLTKALYRAYWVDGEDVSDHKVLLDIARRSGITSAKEMTEEVFGDVQDRRMLETATDRAIAKGTPGVPAFWIEDEVWTDAQGALRRGQLYWGQDRMLFVEAVLRGLDMARPFDQVPGISSLHPRCVREGIMEKRAKLEFWYDFSSPWAFLGWTQLERLKKIFGDRLEIEMKPFLLGVLFREIGAPMLPMAAVSEQKRKYGIKDLSDWVRYWNAVNLQEHTMEKPIEFLHPDVFPIRSPTLLRCAIVDPSCIPVLYRACWEQNINVANEKILAQTLSVAGFNATRLLEQASTQRARDILRANTQEAKDIGLCGVPSYRVSHKTPQGWKVNGGVVWGQDETNVVLDLIAGWDEETSQTVANVGTEHEIQGRPRL
ncbi:protein disulfide with oxidoreductase activity [Lepidopterella palustris CBS 459.81]|uniref:Protein disulfide with oxidoreductase activity n=1 Tax=Lepidopterella palustris CBS 459.81 TaxID=1314670 RepID=A0A8E2EHP0_9PEZI|nr:protein disulfide with oxidoreductase activity [Lepidopterella palustris CBS 459.81]